MTFILPPGNLQPLQAGNGAAPVAANFNHLRANLRTRKWAWTPKLFHWDAWGNTLAPYSWSKRARIVEDTKLSALNTVASNPPNVNDDVRKTFQRLYQLQDPKARGLTLEQCKGRLAQINKRIGELEEARDNYMASGRANGEKLPKLTPGAEIAFRNAKFAEEVARKIVQTYEAASLTPNAAAAKVMLDNAANAVIAAYPNVPPGNAEHLAAVNAAAVVTAATAAAVAPAATALSVANAANIAAKTAAKTAEATLASQTFFKGSAALDNFAREMKKLEKELKEVGGQILESLCNASNKEAYSSVATFNAYYRQVFDEFNVAAGESMNRLNEVGMSIGLPTIREEKRKVNLKFRTKQAIKEHGKTIAAMTAAEALLGGGIAWAYGTGGIGYVGMAGLGILGLATATAANALLLGGMYWLLSDDGC